ncbi:uncharacterized protein [Triticum aestivum]|uniref:uncharacterized protein n=1 Tax=Triticum aestivum TaxID=4565 RepID=UPI001D01245B|nr:uncharacterized protein LOC123182171 [Triticum aestivum]
MVKKQPLSSLFYPANSANNDTPPSSPPTPTATPQAWMWPSCKNPTAHSFRSPSASAAAAVAAKNTASLFVDSAESSSFTNSSARMHHDCAASDSLSTESEASGAAAEDMADAIVRGLRSDRLRFEPRAPSSSILERKPPPAPARGHEAAGAMSFGGGVAVAFESADPYRDFRSSMEEMMTAHGAGDWDWLEKMLGWYLRANGKGTHAAIVSAFVDLVVTTTASCSSGHSSFTLAGSDLESSSAGRNGSFRLRWRAGVVGRGRFVEAVSSDAGAGRDDVEVQGRGWQGCAAGVRRREQGRGHLPRAATAAMHLGCSPEFKVRLHPALETQVSSFQRTLACEPHLRQLGQGRSPGFGYATSGDASIRLDLDELGGGEVVPGEKVRGGRLVSCGWSACARGWGGGQRQLREDRDPPPHGSRPLLGRAQGRDRRRPLPRPWCGNGDDGPLPQPGSGRAAVEVGPAGGCGRDGRRRGSATARDGRRCSEDKMNPFSLPMTCGPHRATHDDIIVPNVAVTCEMLSGATSA